MSPNLSFLFSFTLSAIPMGIITVPGNSDLETCRQHIEKLHEVLFSLLNAG